MRLGNADYWRRVVISILYWTKTQVTNHSLYFFWSLTCPLYRPYLEAPNPQDDINSLEFQVLINDSDAKSQLHSHKLNEERAIMLKFIVAIGLYSMIPLEIQI